MAFDFAALSAAEGNFFYASWAAFESPLASASNTRFLKVFTLLRFALLRRVRLAVRRMSFLEERMFGMGGANEGRAVYVGSLSLSRSRGDYFASLIATDHGARSG